MSLGLFLLATFITQPDSIPRTDKVTFFCLSLINMLWLAEQSHRQNETCRISGASKWVSCVDRKWGFLWGQCIDFLPCHVWECTEKSRFLLRRMPCQLSDSISSQLLLWEIVNITVCCSLFKLFPDVEIEMIFQLKFVDAVIQEKDTLQRWSSKEFNTCCSDSKQVNSSHCYVIYIKR